MKKSLTELSESFRQGLLSRREFVQRVILTTGSAVAASQALTTLGFDAGLVQEAQAKTEESGIEETSGQYPGGGVEVDYFLAKPAGDGPFPAMIVIHENTGLNDFTRNVARKFAREGFVALAPNVISFGALENGGKHAKWMLATMRTGVAVVAPNEIDALNFGFEYLLGRDDVDSEHIGSVGFCWGGARSFTLATANSRLWAAVVFYGSTPPLEHLQNITAPVLGVYGSLDPRITDRVPETAREMLRLGKTFEWEVYARAPHGFFRAADRVAVSDGRAATLAWDLVKDFLERYYDRGQNQNRAAQA